MQVWGDSSGGQLASIRVRAKKARSSAKFTVGHATVTLTFEDLPNNSHAQWFLRLGLAVRSGHVTTLNEITSALPGYKNAASANDWYVGLGLGKNYFGAFSDAVGLPPQVETYLQQRYHSFNFTDGPPKRFAAIGFDAAKVREAVRASAEYLAANPRVDRLKRPDPSAGRRLAAQPGSLAHQAASSRLLSALASPDESDRERVVQNLLEDPELHIDTASEAQLGGQLAEHAVRYGLTVEDARDWLSLAELLTVPYLRRWPNERLAGMLGRLCLAALETETEPGVVADRILAAAALDGRLDVVLENTKRVLSPDSGRDQAELVHSAMRTFGDRARYLQDNDTAIGRFKSWLATGRSGSAEQPHP